MEKTKDRKTKHLKMLMLLLLLIGYSCVLVGCDRSRKTNAEVKAEPRFLGLENILNSDEVVVGSLEEVADVPARIYVDNTGSMEGFTFGEDGRSKSPSDSYRGLMRCIQDMARMQMTEYYVLDANIQDWVLYEDNLYNNFYDPDFYIWWAPAETQPGPLTKLYMENRLDKDCINIVLTDLAEQNLNNTALAEQIQRMCKEGGCEADLYAFKFMFYGKSQVPCPDTSDMMEKMIEGEMKPYYMIITGPSGCMERYRQGLASLLNNAGLEEGVNYYTATSKISMNQDTASFSDTVFSPFADFDELYEEYTTKKREKGKGEIEDNETEKQDNEKNRSSMEELSKNLVRYEDVEQLFVNNPETEVAAFRYEKVSGVKRDEGDWRLNFYVPLEEYENLNLKYSYTCDVYDLRQPDETEIPEGEEQEPQPAGWEKDDDSGIEIIGSIEEAPDKRPGDSSRVYYFSLRNKETEQSRLEKWDAFVLIKIWKEETYVYNLPEWLDEFDTGMTNDYFTHTFNLEGFYNVLFSEGSGFVDGKEVHKKTIYIQIPVLLTDLKK